MYSVLGNHKTMTHRYTVNVIHIYNRIVVHTQHYLTSNHLFCLEQFGFRFGHSTELADLQLLNHIDTEIDNYNVPTRIYLDLSKAFDTLNFDILLNKLDHSLRYTRLFK